MEGNESKKMKNDKEEDNVETENNSTTTTSVSVSASAIASTDDDTGEKGEVSLDYTNWKSLLKAIVENDENIFKDVLSKTSHNELTEFDDETGMTLLMAAASMGRKDMVVELLEHGVPWNAFDRKGQTAGDYAIKNGHQNCIDELVNAGARAEFLFAELELGNEENELDSKEYLQNRAVYNSDGNLIDENNDGVMMPWEAPLMQLHATSLYENSAESSSSSSSSSSSASASSADDTQPRKFSCLNIGFGLGIIDSYFQELEPSTHVIVEAHPDVYKKMQADGWDKKEGVEILFGKWQDMIPLYIERIEKGEAAKFDAIFFDTYGEHYSKDMKKFHQYLPQMLKDGGCYSFFNGFCPRSRFLQGVACQVVTLELSKLGFESIDFTAVELSDNDSSDENWKNVRRKYFFDDTYYMPLAKWKQP